MSYLSSIINAANLPGLVLALIIIGGLCFLMVGGDWLCRGAASLAIRLNVAPVVVGLTVVSIATSTPELFTALIGVIREQPGLAIGNVIGSNAANMGLILGSAALITPIAVHYRLIRWEIPILIAVTLLFAVLIYLGSGITRVGGIILLGVTVGYMLFIVRTAKGSRIEKEIEEEIPSPIGSLWGCLGFILVGTFLLWLGADLLVEAATESAVRMGVSETLVGITVVAIGTSLPELGATVAAAVRKQSGIIIGNIIGSNLFNLMLICGVVGTAIPFPVETALMRLEIPMLIGFTGIFAWFVISHRKVSRIEGGLLLALYAGFIIFSSVSQTGGFESEATATETITESLP